MMNSQEPENSPPPKIGRRLEIIDLEDEESPNEEASTQKEDHDDPNVQPNLYNHQKVNARRDCLNILTRVSPPTPQLYQLPYEAASHAPPPQPPQKARYQRVMEKNRQLQEHNQQLLYQMVQLRATSAEAVEHDQQTTEKNRRLTEQNEQVRDQNNQLRFELDKLIENLLSAANTARTASAEIDHGAPAAGAE